MTQSPSSTTTQSPSAEYDASVEGDISESFDDEYARHEPWNDAIYPVIEHNKRQFEMRGAHFSVFRISFSELDCLLFYAISSGALLLGLILDRVEWALRSLG